MFGVRKMNNNTHFAGGVKNITRQTYINLWTEVIKEYGNLFNYRISDS